jgi:hypothetical protein
MLKLVAALVSSGLIQCGKERFQILAGHYTKKTKNLTLKTSSQDFQGMREAAQLMLLLLLLLIPLLPAFRHNSPPHVAVAMHMRASACCTAVSVAFLKKEQPFKLGWQF